jgi:hypothetical protein
MVIVAWFPTCTWDTEVLDTDALTMYEPVDTTTTWALDELDAAEDDAEDDEDAAPPADPPPNDPLPEEPLEPDPAPDPLLPEDPEVALPEEEEPATCWPTVRFTDATVPVMDDTKLALFAAVCAVLTWDSAEAMLALSRAIWVAEALAASSVAS